MKKFLLLFFLSSQYIFSSQYPQYQLLDPRRLIYLSPRETALFSTAPFVLLSLYKASVQKHPNEIDADEKVSSFVKDIAPCISAVKIIPDIERTEKLSSQLLIDEKVVRKISNTAAVRGNVLYLDTEVANKIKNLSSQPNNKSTRTKNKIIATLQHEAGHVHNNDTFKTRVVDIAAPLVVNALDLGFGSSLFDGSSFTLFGSWQYPIFSWFQLGYKIIFIALIQFAYSRYQEKLADLAIEDDIDILNAAKKYHEKQHQNEEEMFKNCLSNTKLPLYKRLFLRLLSGSRWFLEFFGSHPSHYHRVKSFEERIARLKPIAAATRL